MDTLPTILILSFLVLLGFIFLFVKYLFRKEEELEHKQQEAVHDYKHIIKNAHAKARSLLGKTTEAAEGIMLKTEYVTENIKSEMDQTLHRVVEQNTQVLDQSSHEALSEYQKSLEGMKEEFVNQVKQIVEKMKSSTDTEISDFNKILREETIDSQKYISQKINEKFDTTLKEIETYKQEQVGKIDASIGRIIRHVSEKVIGRAIPINQHEKLVLDSLEQAKKEGFFS